MPREVRLPQLGQTMEEGTVVNCLVKVGDEVKKGDVIFEIETDKATLEMESPADGFVKHILVETDQTLPVGAPVLVLGDKDEEVPQSFVDSLKGGVPAGPASAVAAPPAAEPVRAEAEVSRPAGRVMASPRAKKLAEELGVDLTQVAGTGPGGKITEEDIKKAAASKPAKPDTAEIKLGATIPLGRLQKITAEKMLKSKREIPCFYLTVKADVTDLVALRAKLNETSSALRSALAAGEAYGVAGSPEQADVKISYNDFIMKAVATGLEKYPIMTGQLAGDTIQLAEAINVGLAISVPGGPAAPALIKPAYGGLVAPIIKDVNKKDVKQIARDSTALIEKARSNKLAPADLEGGCITISNLGAFGIDNFIPIVVPGQCSILGIGRITDTCVPGDGPTTPASEPTGFQLVSAKARAVAGPVLVRRLMNMTLSVDHKVTNGAYAAQFLDFVRRLLEDTSKLVTGNW